VTGRSANERRDPMSIHHLVFELLILPQDAVARLELDEHRERLPEDDPIRKSRRLEAA
jgi:hypothetical protein